MLEETKIWWDKALTIAPELQTVLINALIAIGMLVIGIWIARRIRAAARKVTAKSSKIDNTLGNALSNIIYYLLVGTVRQDHYKFELFLI